MSHPVSIPIFYAFDHADFIGKLIVLLLVAASVYAWAIILEKFLLLRRVKRQCREFMAFCGNQPNPEKWLPQLENLAGPLRSVADQALVAMSEVLRLPIPRLRTELVAGTLRAGLSRAGADRLQASMNRAVDEEVLRLEERMGLLGMLVSVCPFLGLLGTAYGVMAAFCGMAAEGSASIDALAPGVSGALLTTVCGLLVAIPALVSYNLMVDEIRILTLQMDNFSEEFLGLLRLRCEVQAGKE